MTAPRNEYLETIWVPILFFSWPVLWILLYGYVIFPHVATENNYMLSCDWEPHYTEPGSVDGEPHYTEPGSVDGEIRVCELNRDTIWFNAFLAGVASAFVAGLLLSMILVLMRGGTNNHPL